MKQISFIFRKKRFTVNVARYNETTFVGYMNTSEICGAFCRYRVECYPQTNTYRLFIGNGTEFLNEGTYNIVTDSTIINAFLTANTFILCRQENAFYKVIKNVGGMKVLVNKYIIEPNQITLLKVTLDLNSFLSSVKFNDLPNIYKVVSFDEILSLVANKELIKA